MYTLNEADESRAVYNEERALSDNLNLNFSVIYK